MTQEEILEYNKMCAEFLGIKLEDTYPINWKEFKHLFNSFEKSLKFHSDWNWIMEVVEAIEKLGHNFTVTCNEVYIDSNILSSRNVINGGVMNSHDEKYFPTIIQVTEEFFSKKQAVVQAINQFLIWYNKNT